MGITNKKKILYVHHAGGFGGAPKSMSIILGNLDKTKFIPTLVNIEKGPINVFFKTLPIKLIEVNGIKPFHGSTVVEKDFKLFIRNWLFLLPSIIRANKVIKELKPDLIHLNSTCLFAFAIAAKLNKIKVITHVREPLRKGIWGAPLRFFCKKYVDGFIAISQFDLDSLNLSERNTQCKEVIYNFVDEIKENDFKNKLRIELKLNDNDVIFLYVARFAKSNGWKELVNMAKKIANNNQNFHFVLVGAVNETDLKFNYGKNIHILPFRSDIPDVLNSADVFVCPFVEPHFARGVIEASAHGLPIIGSNIGGVNELIINNQTGFLYNSVEEFTDQVIMLGNDKKMQEVIGGNGKVYANENFNIDTNLKKTFDFYNKYV